MSFLGILVAKIGNLWLVTASSTWKNDIVVQPAPESNSKSNVSCLAS